MRKLLLFGICWLIGGIFTVFASGLDDSLKNDSRNTTKVYISGDLEISNFESLTSDKKIQIIHISAEKKKVRKLELPKKWIKESKSELKKSSKSISETSNRKEKTAEFKISRSPASDTELSIFLKEKAKALRESFPSPIEIANFHLVPLNFPIHCLIRESKKFKFDFFSTNIVQITGPVSRPRPSPFYCF